MSAEIVDLGHRRLKQQLAGSLALLEAVGASIPADALEPPKPETDPEFAARLTGDAIETLRSGDLLGAASRLEFAARYLRWLEAATRKRAERNQKRREQRKRAKQSRNERRKT